MIAPVHTVGVAPVPWAEVALRCAWPCGTEALRGAIVAAVGGRDAHVDWHGHDAGGRPPRVLYRPGPRLWLYGARAHEHAAALLRVGALRLPGGGVVAVDGADVASGVAPVRVLGKTWRRYRLASPLCPPDVAWRRRPREPGDERRAWATRLLGDSIEGWLADVGVAGRVVVSLCWAEDVPVEGYGRSAIGFVGEWLCNVDLPDGAGLGAARGIGFGEVRRC